LIGMVEFHRVSFSVGGRPVLRDLSLEIAKGETLVLLGRSGAGKTTALKMVNAMVTPDSGSVLVEGKPLGEWDVVRLRRHIGYVIQEAGLFPHFTVFRNIALIPELEGWSRRQMADRVHSLLELLGMPVDLFSQRYPRELSSGQRQRVGVARALAADPTILLFDEPFGALDPVTRHDLQEMLLVLTQRLQKTALFVTHDVREALKLASRIALLQEGRIALVAEPAEFLRADHPEARAFLKCLD
jgi:osmoprotectant transport system ATP-binding protein